MKILINTAFGGFGLNFSKTAMNRYNELAGTTYKYLYEASLIFSDDNKTRTNPLLIQVVEELPTLVGDIKVAEIPDDVEWHIHEYDGLEYVTEDHRKWDETGEI